MKLLRFLAKSLVTLFVALSSLQLVAQTDTNTGTTLND